MVNPAARATLATLMPLVCVLTAVGAVVDRSVARGAPASQINLRPRSSARVGEVGGLDYPRHAIDADGVRLDIATPVRRVVSQEWSLDEYLYALLPPERVVGVSQAAYEPAFSNIADLATRFRPSVAADVEAVIGMHPDLVIVSNSARSDFTELLRSTGVPVYRAATTPTTLAAIDREIGILGYLTGSDAPAALAQAALRRARTFPAIQPHAPVTGVPRVLVLNGSYAYGSDTLFDDVLRVIGAVNVAAVSGVRGYARLSPEEILRSNPGWIVTGAAAGRDADVLARLEANPWIAGTDAGRLGHIIVLEQRVFLAVSPFTTRLIDALRVALFARDPAAAPQRVES